MASHGAVEPHLSLAHGRGVSLLRLAVTARLAIVAVAVCLLCLAVYWALR